MAISPNQQNQALSTADLQRVLFKLKDVTMKSTHCCEIGVVQTIKNSIYGVELFSTGKIIEARCLNNVTASQGDIAVVIFADNDFRQNLDKIKANGTFDPEVSITSHSLAYSIIIGTI